MRLARRDSNKAGIIFPSNHIVYVLLSLSAFVANITSAQLSWETTSTSFKVHPLQASETVGYRFSNSGSEPITIVGLKPGCGCISGKLDKKTYDPGESGVVHVTLNLEKRLGPQLKGIAVKTSDNPMKPTKLYVSTTVPKTYVPSVKRLVWAPDEERVAKSCRIINAHKAPYRLVKAIPLREGLEVELKTIRENYEYELIVKPSSELKNILIPIAIHPAKPEGLDKVKTFTVYALVK